MRGKRGIANDQIVDSDVGNITTTDDSFSNQFLTASTINMHLPN